MNGITGIIQEIKLARHYIEFWQERESALCKEMASMVIAEEDAKENIEYDILKRKEDAEDGSGHGVQ